MPDGIHWLLLLFVAGGILLFVTRILTVQAALLAYGMALLLWIAGGWGWLIPPIFFLLTSTLFTRWPGGSRERDRTRNSQQVLANGLIPALCGLIFIFSKSEILIAAMTGAYAAVTADTWSTEWGTSLGGRPLSLRTFRPTTPGESGAISLVGTIASFSGALLLAAVCMFGGLINVVTLIVVACAGLAGGFIDSIAGAHLQAKWRALDGSWMEEPDHGMDRTQPEIGLRWMGNNTVNFLASLTGALVAGVATLIRMGM